jgi:hypothetical protein
VSRSNLPERIVLGLARIIAGPERRHWLDAMEAELAHLPTRRLDWTLGSLVAAVKDRSAREWRFGLALGILPGLAVAATLPATLFLMMAVKAAGLPQLLIYTGQVLAPLPFAWLLGRLRPAWSALWVGAAGFVAYQALPFIAWRVLIGNGMWFFWGPTLFPLGVPVPLVLPIWLLGAWWGARTTRRTSLGPRSSKRS